MFGNGGKGGNGGDAIGHDQVGAYAFQGGFGGDSDWSKAGDGGDGGNAVAEDGDAIAGGAGPGG